jgi:hypothetical protein
MRDYTSLTVGELEAELGRRALVLECKFVVDRLEETAEFRAAIKQFPPNVSDELAPQGIILFSAQAFDKRQAMIDLAMLLDHEREIEEPRKK